MWGGDEGLLWRSLAIGAVPRIALCTACGQACGCRGQTEPSPPENDPKDQSQGAFNSACRVHVPTMPPTTDIEPWEQSNVAESSLSSPRWLPGETW